MEAWDSNFISELRLLRTHVEMNGFPGAAIAGGCLRDMMLDKPISDIDIFYPAYKIDGIELPITLKKETSIVTGFSEAMISIYENSFTELTHRAVHKKTNLPVQFIAVDLAEAGCENITEYVHEFFPLTISQVSLDWDGLHISSGFLSDSSHKYLVFNKNTPAHYVDKITAKYNDWKNLNF